MKIRLVTLVGAFLVMTMLAAPALFADTFQVRLNNTDDILNAYLTNSNVTSQLVATNTFGHATGLIDITALLAPGANLLEFKLDNLTGGYAWGIEIDQNTSTVLFHDSCGISGVVGCHTNDQTLFTNRLIDEFQITIAAVPEPGSLLLLGTGLLGVVGAARRKWLV